MVTRENVQAAVSELRQMLQLDGADLDVVETGESSATFALHLEGASCAECVLPSEMIQSILAQQLSQSLPQITHIVINDPRDQAPNGAAH